MRVIKKQYIYMTAMKHQHIIPSVHYSYHSCLLGRCAAFASSIVGFSAPRDKRAPEYWNAIITFQLISTYVPIILYSWLTLWEVVSSLFFSACWIIADSKSDRKAKVLGLYTFFSLKPFTALDHAILYTGSPLASSKECFVTLNNNGTLCYYNWELIMMEWW